jgi:hypothetical protein
MSKPARIQSFAEFWPFYVGQHRRHGTRVMHFAGSSAGLALWAAALAEGRPVYLLYGLVAGYALAWMGHFFIEKNRPATFQYPVWSFLADWKMYGLMWRGKMTAEAAALGFSTPRVSSLPLVP